MLHSRVLPLLALVAPTLLAGCGGGRTPAGPPLAPAATAPATATYLPLVLGTVWKYHVPDGTDRLRLVDTTLRRGLLWHNALFKDAAGTLSELQYRHAAGGLYLRRDGRQELAIKTPLVAGNTWSGGGLDYEILSTAATAVVPLGTYHGCLLVQETRSDGEGNRYRTCLWYAPGVGIVRKVTWVNDVVTRAAGLKRIYWGGESSG